MLLCVFPQSFSLCHFAPSIDGLVDTLNCRYLILRPVCACVGCVFLDMAQKGKELEASELFD